MTTYSRQQVAAQLGLTVAAVQRYSEQGGLSRQCQAAVMADQLTGEMREWLQVVKQLRLRGLPFGAIRATLSAMQVAVTLTEPTAQRSQLFRQLAELEQRELLPSSTLSAYHEAPTIPGGRLSS